MTFYSNGLTVTTKTAPKEKQLSQGALKARIVEVYQGFARSTQA